MESRDTAIVSLLNKQLAETVDLRSQVRQASFNVRGRYIRELMLLFEGFARDLQLSADLIAERISSLGGKPVATVQYVARVSELREYPLDAVNASEHLEVLLASYSRYEMRMQHNIKEVQGDVDTLELLGRIGSSIERNLWLLEAYLEGIVVGSEGKMLPIWVSMFENRMSPADAHGLKGS